jgi:hypothetical protein
MVLGAGVMALTSIAAGDGEHEAVGEGAYGISDRPSLTQMRVARRVRRGGARGSSGKAWRGCWMSSARGCGFRGRGDVSPVHPRHEQRVGGFGVPCGGDGLTRKGIGAAAS